MPVDGLVSCGVGDRDGHAPPGPTSPTAWSARWQGDDHAASAGPAWRDLEVDVVDDVTVRWAPVEAGRTGDDPRTAVAHRRVASPLGEVVLVGTGDTLTALHLPTSAPPDPAGIGPEDPDLLMSAVRQLDEYFAGTRTRFDLALAPLGTAFQHRVWRRLLAIPHGRTCSYGEVAEDVGGPRSTRAVGSANGSNPIAIVIPCHRVIGADGTLVGYAGGLAAKRFLLDLESGTRPLFDPDDVA